MTEFKTDFERRLKKSTAAKLRAAGHTVMVPKGPVMDRIAYLMDYVSLVQLSEETSIPLDTLYSWRTRSNDGVVHRMYAERVMAYELPADATTHVERVRGAQRIYRGLARRGFGMQTICDMIGLKVCSLKNVVCEGTSTKKSFGPELYRELLLVAAKLETQSPYDLTPLAKGVNVTKGKAKSYGWIDIGAWDLDTVHRADARPDITGQCGKMPGVLIHLREDQPLCDACVYVTTDPHGHNKIDPFKLYELYCQGLVQAELAQLLGVTRELVSQYGQYLTKEERRYHTLSMVDKTAMTAYCDLCLCTVQIYNGTGSRVICANGVRKRMKGYKDDLREGQL